MEILKCPICNSEHCTIEPSSDGRWSKQIFCTSTFLGFLLHDSVSIGDSIDIQKRYNFIYSFLLRSPYKIINYSEYRYEFCYFENTEEPQNDSLKINIAKYINDYPRDIGTRIDSILLNLSIKYKDFGKEIRLNDINPRLLYCESENPSSERQGIFTFLQELNLIKVIEKFDVFIISAEGWKKIGELQKRERIINQGFIAMAFCEETKQIGDIFKKVISKCKYAPRKIDEKEHNNQIVPEIFFEISRSKFIVVDVTVPNYGAYYEAGYAEALGKEVIVCCRKDVFNSKEKPHFDISQKSTVVWEDEKDLEDRLYKRIEATVGLNT